ncbi:MAG: SdpI family protein [Balneola sp.]
MDIKSTFKKEWYVILVLAAPFIASIYLWNDMPDIVPTHFNAQGEADDYGPKWINAFLLPGIAVLTYLFLLIIPAIDPKKRIERTQKPITAIRVIISIFLVGIYTIVMMKTFNVDAKIDQFVFVGVGVLIVFVGNYMNSIKPNYFIGLRTPWTLENPEVWKRTHRFSSKLWIIGGSFMIISTFIPSLRGSLYVIVGLVAILAIVPFAYSYVIFNKLQKSES